MSLATLVAFCGVVMIAYVTPGPDWFVVLRRALDERRHGFVAMAGVQTGLLVHMAAAALGVSAVLVASAEAFTVLKLVGAAYLVWLGVTSLLSARQRLRRPADQPATSEAGGHAPTPARSVYAQAFLANVLNPKAALFFVAVLPQFLDLDGAVARQVLALGALDVVLGLAWWSLFVVAVTRARRFVDSRRGRAAIDATSGAALIGLGAVLATTSRRAV